MMRTAGFHLIEILTALTVITIIYSISLPSYHTFLTRGKRLDAAHHLSQLATQLEHYFIENNTYAGAAPIITQRTTDYQFSLLSADAHQYVIAAIPTPTHASLDQACGTLILNSLGEKHTSGTAKSENCW